MSIELTRMQRIHLRVLVGGCIMLERQLEQLGPELRTAIGLPEPSVPAAWRGAIIHAVASAVAADEPPERRVSTTDNEAA